MKKQTIAQKKAAQQSDSREKRKSNLRIGMFLCVPLLILWWICQFAVPGYTFTALICMCLIAVILFYTLMPYIGRFFPRFTRTAMYFVSAGLLILLLMFVGTEYFIYQAAQGDLFADPAYVIVLGAKVRDDGPSVSLMDRITAAQEYLLNHPDTIAIVSGGMGNDEPMTEAQCMYDYLVAAGISANRIWKEERAESTDENLRYSLDMIRQRTGMELQEIGVLSSEYHLLRARLMAQKLGVECIGIPAKTSRVTQLMNQCMREFAGVWHFLILGY